MCHHTFRWHNKSIRLIYSIEERPDGRQLILEDAVASSIRNVESVPDWKIEIEAEGVAADHDARYL